MAAGFVRTAAFDFSVTMYSFTILIYENPGAIAVRDRIREQALRLFISIHGAYLSSTRHRHHGPTTPMAATVQTCLNEMKRNFGIACVLLLVMAAVYARLWFRARSGDVQGAMKQAEGMAV